MSTALKPVDTTVKSLTHKIEKDLSKSLSRFLPNPDDLKRMIGTLAFSIYRNPKLTKCTWPSLVGCASQAAILDLDLESPTGQAWIIPFGNQATLVIGYKGLVNLAFRSGFVASFDAQIVYEKDPFREIMGSDRKIAHECAPDPDDRGEPIGAYAIVKLKTGGECSKYMTKKQIEAVKARSPGGNSNDSPWNSKHEEDRHAMWKKTVIKRLIPTLPVEARSPLSKAIALDMQADMGVKQSFDFSPEFAADQDGSSEPEALPHQVEGVKKKVEKAKETVKA